MRAGHGLTDFQKQQAAVLQAEVAIARPGIDALAFDVFHDEERPPVGSAAAVDEVGDEGVVEIGEDLALAAEAFQDFGRIHAVLDQLEGRLLPEIVVADGQVDSAHSAAADLADYAPVAHARADDGVGAHECLGRAFHRRSDGSVAFPVGSQQRLDFAADFGPGGARVVEEDPLLAGRQVGGGVEQILDVVPVFHGGNQAPAATARPSSSRRSQAWATLSSRRTWGTSRPRAAADSSAVSPPK